MPIKIRKAFEQEYGKKKGDRMFAWENKHHEHKQYEHKERFGKKFSNWEHKPLMGVNFNQRVSPNTYPYHKHKQGFMGVDFKKSVPVREATLFRIKNHERRN